MAKFKVIEQDTVKTYRNGIPVSFVESKLVEDALFAHDALQTDFLQDNYEAEINIQSVYGNHWAEYNQRDLELKFKDRILVNLPTLYPKMQSLLGFQRANREVWEAKSGGGEDELLGELINAYFRYLENNDDPEKLKFLESDAFKDAAFCRFGAIECFIGPDAKGNSQIHYKNWPYTNVLFDRGVTSINMTECQRIQLFERVHIDELKCAYPDIEDEKYERMNEGYTEYSMKDYSDKLKSIIRGMIFQDDTSPEKKEVKKIIDYQIKLVNGYETTNVLNGEQFYFETLEDAQNYAEDIIEKIDMNNLAEIIKVGVASNEMEETDIDNFEAVKIKKSPRRMVQRYVIAGDVLVEEPRLLAIDEMPVKIIFCLFMRGQWWSIVDLVRNNQQLLDRYYSHVDFAMGAATKTGGEVNTDAIDDQYNTIESVTDKFKRGDLIYKHGYQKAIEPYVMNSIDPKIFQFSSLISNILVEAVGGANWQGVQEKGGVQSGDAIERLQAMAQMITLELLDNYARWKEALGRVSVKLMKKYINNKTAVSVFGDTMTAEVQQAMQQNGLFTKSIIEEGAGTLVLNDPEIAYYQKNRIADATFNIFVRSVTSRSDENEATFEKLTKLLQLGINPGAEAFIELLNIKATTKGKILASVKEQKQIEAQQREIEMKKEQAKANNEQMHNMAGASDIMARADNKEREIALKEQEQARKIGNGSVFTPQG